MTNILVIDPEKCTSCRLCELACSQRNDGTFRPTWSRIDVTIKVDEAFYFPRVCFQCEDSPCVDVCPTSALYRDEKTGAVVLEQSLCNECRMCEVGCPYGVIQCRDGKARKCELCGGDPECVRFCSPGALRYESGDTWPQAARQAYADRLQALAKEAQA